VTDGQLHYEDVKVGDAMTEWVRRTNFMNWNRWAAVNDEFFYMHMQDDAGRLAGNEKGGFGMGNIRFSYLLNAVRDWAGPDAVIKELGCQFRKINEQNDVLTCVGTVVETKVEKGEHLVKLDINIVNQDGIKTTPGHAVVDLPSRS
jgi:hypothetical protein